MEILKKILQDERAYALIAKLIPDEPWKKAAA